MALRGFSDSSVVKNLPADAEDMGSISDPSRWGAYKCVHHNYWAYALEPGNRNQRGAPAPCS